MPDLNQSTPTTPPTPATQPTPAIQNDVHDIKIDMPEPSDLTFKPVTPDSSMPEQILTEPQARPETVDPTMTQTQPESLIQEPQSSKLPLQKILKIAIPAVVAILLIAGGYFAYSVFMPDTSTENTTTNETANDTIPSDDILNDDMSNLEESLIENLEIQTNQEIPADYSETQEETIDTTEEEQIPQQKVPRI